MLCGLCLFVYLTSDQRCWQLGNQSNCGLHYSVASKYNGVGLLYNAPGNPWENAFVELFNSRLWNEQLNRKEFGSLLEAQVLGCRVAAGLQRSATAFVAGVSGTDGVRRALARKT